MGIPANYYTNPSNLKALTRKFLLKRTKAQINLQLPTLHSETKDVEWGGREEQKLAEDIHSLLQFSCVSQRLVDHAIAALGNETLPLLVRARQACVYPGLMKNHIEKLN